MKSARYYEVEAQAIRRAMFDLKSRRVMSELQNNEIRALLGRLARSYEEIAAELEENSAKTRAVEYAQGSPLSGPSGSSSPFR